MLESPHIMEPGIAHFTCEGFIAVSNVKINGHDYKWSCGISCYKD